MSDSPHFTVVGGTAVVGNALADKTIPQDTLLPLLDAPLDELATYLADRSWEARKDYLNNMMGDSIMSLVKQLDIFKNRIAKPLDFVREESIVNRLTQFLRLI